MMKRLREAADIVKRSAARHASWSRRIPASLEVTEEDYAVVIRANPAVAPQARAFELGARHPLNYPNQRRHNRWGNTPHRPFFAEAVDDTDDEVVTRCAMVVDDWTRKLGYEVT